jgi:Caspase domain
MTPRLRSLVPLLCLLLAGAVGTAAQAQAQAAGKPTESAAAAAAAATAASALTRRVALVVGNGRYNGVPPLPNALNDADDMCKALRELRFDVICVRDVRSRRDFRRAVQDFRAKLGPGTAGLFFYAGHGMQIDGENYLLPTHAEIERREDVEDEALSLRYLMATLDDAGNEFNLIILDACRNSPFARGFSRATSRGLAPVSDTPIGSLVLYSTAANDTASDGRSGERNSPFTKHLLSQMRVPGQNVEAMIKRVSASVQSDTQIGAGKRQVPFTYGSFTGEFCFAGCEDPRATEAARAQAERLKQEQQALERRRVELETREAEMRRQREAEANRPATRSTEPALAPPTQGTPKPPAVVVPPTF